MSGGRGTDRGRVEYRGEWDRGPREEREEDKKKFHFQGRRKQENEKGKKIIEPV